jgi:hypothetical protein
MATRFDIRIDDESVLCRDDAAAVIYLLGKLATADEIDRVLLAAEGIRQERCDAGTWNPSPDWRDFAASVRERMLTVDLPDPLDLEVPPLCPECDSQLFTIGGESICPECPVSFVPVDTREPALAY